VNVVHFVPLHTFDFVPPTGCNLRSLQGKKVLSYFYGHNKKDSQKIISQSVPPNNVHATSASVLLDREVPPLDPPAPLAPPLSDPCLQFKQAGVTLLEKLKVQHLLAISNKPKNSLKCFS